jgi:DNA mismatch endonuclease, patch repair protein
MRESKTSQFHDVPEVVRRRMARVRKKDSKPELVVRKLAHRLGYRFRLHRSDLPGTPDLIFPRMRKAIFVHGCFWHRHNCALAGKVPSKRQEYWLPKLRRNTERDADVQRELVALGWEVPTIWECETREERDMATRLKGFLGRN